MKDCGGHFHGKHLKRSLDYVMNPEKTQDGRLVGAINCQVDSAFEQMKATKRKFGKVDKRQGYHIILSFKEDEVNPDMAFEITRRFVEGPARVPAMEQPPRSLRRDRCLRTS